MGYSDADTDYFRKYGEWEDIALIVTSLNRPTAGRSLLSNFDWTGYRLVARAIYHIGKTRLLELLALEMPSRLLADLIVEVPDKAFRSLDDASLLRLLSAQETAVRKAAALKCVCALSKSRLRGVLENYISEDEKRFYNVVHWLDLGTSAPNEVARRAAQKAIASI